MWRVRCAYGSVASRKRSTCCAANAVSESAVARWLISPTTFAGGCGSSASPQRPMPVSSFRCTGMSSGISPLTGDDELEPRLARLGELVGRAHDDDPRLRKLAPQLEGFGDGDDAERRGPGLERRPSDVARAVAVAVRLHDGPELGPVERLEQPPRVVANRAEVDRDLAPVHASSLARERAAGLRSRRLRRGHSAATLRARRAAALRRLPRPRAAAPCPSRGTRP